MRQLLDRVIPLFSLRLFLNLVLWTVVAWMLFGSNSPDTDVLEVNLCKTATLLSLMGVTYVNNFLLVPQFLDRKHVVVYLSLASLLVVGYSFCYSVFILHVIHDQPSIELSEIILFTVPMKPVWDIHEIEVATIGYSFVYGLWVLVLTMAWYVHDHARQKKITALALQKQSETELGFLKAQINPHFLFNTLNNLYAMALQKSDDSPEAILKLSSILRYLLYESNTPTVPFEKEKEIIQAYIAIELLRLEDNCRLTTIVTTDAPAEIPPLLWLPVLENLFKHGARTIANDHDLEFRFEMLADRLTIYSSNRSKLLARSNDYSGGIGLKNLEKRLELLYPKAYSMVVSEEDEKFTLCVHINLA